MAARDIPMRMIAHPRFHRRGKALLQEFPGLRIMLDHGAMENL